MLVVLVLIAIIAGVATVNTNPDPRQTLIEQARRVGLLMGVAAEESRLRQLNIAWSADLRGYRFVVLSGNPTEPPRALANDDLLRERPWNPGLVRLNVVDMNSGTERSLVSSDAPPVVVASAREWIQPRWRLDLTSEQAQVSVEFDAAGHGHVLGQP
jgi:general secretion pathway protein H